MIIKPKVKTNKVKTRGFLKSGKYFLFSRTKRSQRKREISTKNLKRYAFPETKGNKRFFAITKGGKKIVRYRKIFKIFSIIFN